MQALRAQLTERLVRYNVRAIEHHARLLFVHLGGDGFDHDWWLVLTPDGDKYAEDFGSENVDIMYWRQRPGDRRVPAGIPPATVYDFAVLPTPVELNEHMIEAQAMAPGERLRLGLAPRLLHRPRPFLVLRRVLPPAWGRPRWQTFLVILLLAQAVLASEAASAVVLPSAAD